MNEQTHQSLLEGITSGSTIICYTKCYPCMFGDHFEPKKWHTWADEDDVLHGFITRHVDVRKQKCGCHCSEVSA